MRKRSHVKTAPSPMIEMICLPFNEENRDTLAYILMDEDEMRSRGVKIWNVRTFSAHGQEYLSFRTSDVNKAEELCLDYGFTDKAADMAFDAKAHTLKRFEIVIVRHNEPADQTEKLRQAFENSVLVQPAHEDGISEVFARHVGAVRRTISRAMVHGVTIQEPRS